MAVFLPQGEALPWHDGVLKTLGKISRHSGQQRKKKDPEDS